MRVFICGLGAVGFSFLRKIKENNLLPVDDIYCVDGNPNNRSKFINLGFKSDNYIDFQIKQNNYLLFLNKLNEGDYLLDFIIDVKNLDILKYCLNQGIHYLSTADSSWNPDPTWISDHQHYIEYLKMKREYQECKNTCLIQFGMNPGLVSSFAKTCIKDIVKYDDGRFVSRHRERLTTLLNEKKFALVAKNLGVTDIQEVDNDDQETNIPFDINTCYSTWNVWAFYYETISSPEIAFGDKERYYSYKQVYDCDAKDLYLSLLKSGYEYEATTFSPQGIVKGHISTHEEVFTIRKLFTYGRYKPCVHFVYSPCNYALNSVKNFKTCSPSKQHIIDKNEVIGGGESVGVIIQGKNFKTRYFGNYLNTNDIDETATILQVSASAYAGFVYMLEHPNCGLLFPEDVDEDEVLNYAKKYLKNYISVECPKIKMTLGRDVD